MKEYLLIIQCITVTVFEVWIVHQNFYKTFMTKKNHCARTKCEAIIKNTFLKFAQENLKNDLKQVRYVSILGEASNHRATAIH